MVGDNSLAIESAHSWVKLPADLACQFCHGCLHCHLVCKTRYRALAAVGKQPVGIAACLVLSQFI